MAALAMTFDDGPDERCTPALLDALARHGATATFFVIAPRAAAQPQLIRRMLAHGHSIGLHCEVHIRHSQRDRTWVHEDTDRALARLRRLGVVPSLWRVPWGDAAPWTAAVAQHHDLRLVRWTVDTHDWRGDSAARMFAATREALGPGAVVLAHDGIGPGARRCDATETLRYLDLVAAHAAARDLRLEALR